MVNPDAVRWQKSIRDKILHCKRGYRALPLSAEMLLEFFKSLDGTKAYKCEGLPPDAQIQQIQVDPKTGQIVLILSSNHFPPTVLSTRVPWLSIKFAT